MEGAHYGKPELIVEQRQRIDDRPKPAFDIHILGPMQGNQKESLAF